MTWKKLGGAAHSCNPFEFTRASGSREYATGSAMRGNLRKAWEEESRGDDGHSLAPAVKLDQEADALVAAGL